MISRTKTSESTFWRFAISCAFLGCFALYIYGPMILKKVVKPRRHLNVYLIASIIESDLLDEFEEKTGIKVYVKYCEFNPAMHTQLKITGGKGYDVVSPSSCTFELLRKEGLLQPIDVSKISNFPNLDKRLLDKGFDPG